MVVRQRQPTPPPVQASAQPAIVRGKDSDGDNDGSKVAEIEKPKASSGPVGTIIDTTACVIWAIALNEDPELTIPFFGRLRVY